MLKTAYAVYNVPMQTGVFYFSGTGNSFAAAKQIAQQTNGTVVPLTAEFFENGGAVNFDRLIVVYPSYAYGMPKMLHRFFREATFNCSYIAIIVTYGSKYGATASQAAQVLKRRGIKVDYLKGVKSVENYIPIFGLMPEEKIQKTVERQRSETSDRAAELMNAEQNSVRLFRPFSWFVNKLFCMAVPFLALFYKFTNRCTRCGICRRICPARAITTDKEGKPKVTARKCEHCQGCLNWCPAKAIRYVRLSKNSRRYHHPEVTLDEMFKRD